MTIDDKTVEALRQIHSQLKLDEEVTETKIMNGFGINLSF